MRPTVIVCEPKRNRARCAGTEHLRVCHAAQVTELPRSATPLNTPATAAMPMRNRCDMHMSAVEAESTIAATICALVLASLSVGLVVGAGLMRALGAR